MKWKERVGLDGFDLAIHAVVTLALCAMADGFFSGPVEDMAVTGIVALSAVALGFRRHLSRAALPPDGAEGHLLELEQRMGDVEQLHQRVAELEERLDFTERLLVRQQEAEGSRLGSGTGD